MFVLIFEKKVCPNSLDIYKPYFNRFITKPRPKNLHSSVYWRMQSHTVTPERLITLFIVSDSIQFDFVSPK